MMVEKKPTTYMWAAAQLLLLLVTQLPLAVDGTATLHITFINYRNLGGYDSHNYPCDPLVNRACDNVFDICVDKRNGSDSITDCAFYKGRTGEYTNNDDITFDYNMMGLANPVTVPLDIWQGVKLKVAVTDDDSSHLIFNGHDPVDSLHSVYYCKRPGVNGTFNRGATKVIQGRLPRIRPTSLTVKFEVMCDVMYYGSDCTKLCIPKDDDVHGHFMCDSKGDKECLTGWDGLSSNCTIPADCRAYPCLGGGSCSVTSVGNFLCNCRPGFTGLRCQITIHDCKSIPCLNNGTCSSNGTCICPGSHNGPRCDTRRPTIGCVTCDNGGTCEADRCICLPGTWGPTCQYTNTSIRCHNSGRYMGGRCFCPRGVSGRYCQVRACDHISCQNGGGCMDGWCHCPPGFGGRMCEIPMGSVDPGSYRRAGGSTPVVRVFHRHTTKPANPPRGRNTADPTTPAVFYTRPTPRYGRYTTLDPIFATPHCPLCDSHRKRCQNGGRCASGGYCRCTLGNLGDRCEVKLCDFIHCYHGGSCLGGRCVCQQGYTGVYCQDRADTKCDLYYYGEKCDVYCKPRDDQQGHYRCDSGGRKMCLTGWEDVNTDCTIVGDDCQGHKCQNRGICQDEDNSYSCTCLPGYIGTYCEIEVDECVSNPCHNGGTCKNLVNRFECECPPDYPRHLSESCKKHVCNHGNPCQHGGTCHGSGQCSCSQMYTGAKCEVILCEILPCHNGGTCRQGRCHCPTPFTGSHCHKVTGTCSSRPCMYGGTCMQDGDSYSCACREKFTGEHCQYWRNNSTKLRNVRVDALDGAAESCILHPTPIILLGLLLGLIIIVLILAACLCRERRRRTKQAKIAQHATSNFPNPIYVVSGGGFRQGRSGGRRQNSTSGNSTSRSLGAHGISHSALPGVKTISMVNEGFWDQNTDANFVFGSQHHSTKWAPGGAIDCCGPPPYTGYDSPEVAAGGEHGIGGEPNEEALDEGVDPKDFELGGEAGEEVEYEALDDMAQARS